MARLIPDFKPENRNIQTEYNQTVLLSDWTNTYLLRVSEKKSRTDFIEQLKNMSGVVYAEPNGVGTHDGFELSESPFYSQHLPLFPTMNTSIDNGLIKMREQFYKDLVTLVPI